MSNPMSLGVSPGDAHGDAPGESPLLSSRALAVDVRGKRKDLTPPVCVSFYVHAARARGERP